jgi:hypothetical protein
MFVTGNEPSLQKTALLLQSILEMKTRELHVYFEPMHCAERLDSAYRLFLGDLDERMQCVLQRSQQLPYEDAARILSSVLKQKEESQDGLPEPLQSNVDDVLNANRLFLYGIDKFMHRTIWDIFEVDIVKAIIEICPEFLSSFNDEGEYPIHSALHAIETPRPCATAIYVPLLAQAGLKHKIGREGRGGVLDSCNFVRGRNVLEEIAGFQSPNTVKAFIDADPPLLLPEDIRKYNLIHHAVRRASISTVEFFVDVDPSCIYQQDNYGLYPLENVGLDTRDQYGPATNKKYSIESSYKIAQYLIERALNDNPDHHEIGGLFKASERLVWSDDGDGEEKVSQLVLKSFVDNLGEKEAWSCIEKALANHPEIPILHKTIQCAPDQIFNVMRSLPDSAFLRDKNNRLPIHVALEQGLKWSSELVAIININISHLKDKDPLTNLHPFVLAAVGNSDLRTIHHLLRLHPGQVEVSNDLA